MKIKGQRIPLNTSVVVLPRSDGNDIVFELQAVQGFDKFDTMVPEPIPPTITRPGEPPSQDFSDADYLAAVEARNEKRVAYIFLESIKATKDLEWEKVNLSDPSTWHLYAAELQESNLSAAEVMKLMSEIMSVNGLNEDKMNAARARFLAQRTQQLK